jgi:hypothetical protein
MVALSDFLLDEFAQLGPFEKAHRRRFRNVG